MTEKKTALRCNDVLLAMFAAAQKCSGHSHVRAHEHTLHGMVYRLQNNFPLLECFVFSADPVFPFSRALEEALGTLQLAGLLNRPTLADWEVIGIRPSGQRYFEEVLQGKLSSREHKQLQEIAAEFLTRVIPAPEYFALR